MRNFFLRLLNLILKIFVIRIIWFDNLLMLFKATSVYHSAIFYLGFFFTVFFSTAIFSLGHFFFPIPKKRLHIAILFSHVFILTAVQSKYRKYTILHSNLQCIFLLFLFTWNSWELSDPIVIHYSSSFTSLTKIRAHLHSFFKFPSIFSVQCRTVRVASCDTNSNTQTQACQLSSFVAFTCTTLYLYRYVVHKIATII